MTRRIIRLETAASTMIEAARLADAGCESGTVVVAERQTAGHGRYQRPWHSPAGTGLYFTVVLRLPLAPEAIPIVTLSLGLAAAEAVTRTAGLAPDLRWPNDVLLNGRKCAGILTELHNNAVLAGIGVNVNQESFPEDLRGIATSLRLESGRAQDREALLAALLEAIDQHAGLLVREGPEPVLRLFTEASSYARGRRVTVEQDGRVLTGVTAGLDRHGFLILEEDSGARSVIMAGGVRPAS